MVLLCSVWLTWTNNVRVCVQLKAKTAEFRGRLTRGETLADVQAGASAALTYCYC